MFPLWPGRSRRKKSRTGSCLNQRDRATCGSKNKPDQTPREARQTKIGWRGFGSVVLLRFCGSSVRRRGKHIGLCRGAHNSKEKPTPPAGTGALNITTKPPHARSFSSVGVAGRMAVRAWRGGWWWHGWSSRSDAPLECERPRNEQLVLPDTHAPCDGDAFAATAHARRVRRQRAGRLHGLANARASR